MIRRSVILRSATIALCALFVACNSGQPGQIAVAAPPTGFHDEPKKFGKVELPYEDSTAPQWKAVRSSLDSFYRRQTAAGFNGSVLVGYKGKILYERYFGPANREQNIPWGPQTANQLASTTKTFTSAAVLYLHEHKYLNIDDSVQQYIKNWPYKGLTIRMLLCHRSGLPDYLHFIPAVQKDQKTPMYNAQVLQFMAERKPPLEARPNARFKYCNTNYLVLASIIEEVTDMKYKDFMKKYFFDPLGMTSTFVFDPADGLPANATISYKGNWLREPVMFADGVYGDKGIYSTVEDMYRWDQSLYRNTLLSNQTLELAYGPCSFEKPGVKNYGLGWRMLCYPDGYKVIYHNGWWHGNNNCFYRFVKDNFTIIVLGNKYTTSIYRQPPIVYNIVIGSADTSRAGGFGETEE